MNKLQTYLKLKNHTTSRTNAQARPEDCGCRGCRAFVDLGYHVISGGTDNHLMLIDLRTKFPEITGRKVEDTLVKADITVNKNMVPFDSRSPFQTSGLRIGTPAITTRGMKEEHMPVIAGLIDQLISDIENEELNQKIKKQVNEMMGEFRLNYYLMCQTESNPENSYPQNS